MVASLEEVEPIVADQIDDAMLLGETARPDVRAEMAQGLRFPDPDERISYDRLNKF